MIHYRTKFKPSGRGKPYPCACGCHQLIVPQRLDQRGRFTRSLFFSAECKRNHRISQNQILRPSKRKDDHLRVESMTIHPVLDQFLARLP